MPTCPYCHRKLLHCAAYDEYNDSRVIYQYWRGCCLACFRRFTWTERFDFTDLYDLEEEEYDHSYEEAEKENL